MQQNMMGPNIVITESSSNLRALGRNALAGKWKIAMIALVVYELCIGIPPVILNELFGVNVADMYYSYNSGGMGLYYDYGYIYDSMPTYSFLSSIYTILVTGAFMLGITLFFLAMFRRQRVGVSDIFLGFEQFAKAMGLLLFQSLFIALWSLLLIVPGVIAALRYSQAFFILADDPAKGIRQCMNESKQMMKGNCTKYFCLQLSFIGWMILSVIPASLIQEIFSLLNAPVVVQSLVAVIAYLFMVPVTAYQYSTFAGFYEILAGHLIKETEPAPIEPDAIPVPGAVPGSVYQEEHPETSEPAPTEDKPAEEKGSTETDDKPSDDASDNLVSDVPSAAEGASEKKASPVDMVDTEKKGSKAVDVTAVMESSTEEGGAESSKDDGRDDSGNSFIPKEMK